ncbi:hypothetical protein HPB47_019758, partial [Ixodes persulcatus]
DGNNASEVPHDDERRVWDRVHDSAAPSTTASVLPQQLVLPATGDWPLRINDGTLLVHSPRISPVADDQRTPRKCRIFHSENFKINRRPIPDMDQVMNELVLHSKAETKQNTFMFIDFFRTPKMRRNTSALFIIWALGSFVYYNVVLSATKVPGNPYLNYAISSSIEIPAALLGLFVATRWSRRKSQSIFLVLAGLSVLPMPFLSIASMPWLSITSNVLLRFFILSAGFIKWIMVLEVFRPQL